MRPPSVETWTAVAIAAATAAGISAAMAGFSLMGGNTILAIVSGISLIILAMCSFSAWTVRSRISLMKEPEEEVRCLKLKRPGIERRGEEIVPKGKMPKE